MIGAAHSTARLSFGLALPALLWVCLAQQAGFAEQHPRVGATHPEQCRACHPRHWREWQDSFHARSLVSQGFLKGFRTFIEEEARVLDRQTAMICLDCHAPLLQQAEDARVVGIARQILDGRTGELAAFGVTCAACHRKDGAFAGPIEDPVPNPFHRSVHTAAQADAGACRDCHSWRAASVPCSLVFDSWAGSKAAAAGRSCQTCHMPPDRGPAAVGGPDRTIHSHRFPGGRSPSLLEEAIDLSLDGHFRDGELTVAVSLENLAGHHVPDG